MRRRLRRIATTALTAAVVLGPAAGAGIAKAGFFSDTASRLFGRSRSLDLAPIVGAPANVAQELAQELVTAGKNNKLTITPNGTGSSYVLKGYLIATGERKGAKISYIMDINDSKGQKVGRVLGEQLVPGRSGADPWSGVDSAAAPRRQDGPEIAAACRAAAASWSPGPAPSASTAGRYPGARSRVGRVR
jgi:hypothetical protein